MLKRNFHTHTSLCKHAGGMPLDYAMAALQQGVTTLAFTDHAPYPDGRWDTVRMDYPELPTYVKAVREAKERNPMMEILLGLECEYDPACIAYFREEFLGKFSMELLILGMHSYQHEGAWHGIYGTEMDTAHLLSYTNFMLEAMQTGIYAFVAHPDLFGMCRQGWDAECTAAARDIAQAALACGMPLEINSYGLRKRQILDHGEFRPMYPRIPFWEVLGEYDVPVLVNSDAHQPEDVWGKVEQGIQIAERFGLKVVNDTFWREKTGEE